ncbi:MAG: cobalt-precorrin-6A reductase [Paracoccaceae bacterium]
MPTLRPLILGGTSEANARAALVAARGWEATLSYAGRTAAPRAQPVAVRIGGFGGAAGLAAYMAREGVTHLVDATHPFAARISRNAVEAARTAGVPLAALVRPPWRPGSGDDWRDVADTAGAVAALDGPARRVFLAIGRHEVAAFAAAPRHRYLLRLVDPPEMPVPLPRHDVVLARGPFDPAGDRALMAAHGIEVVVAKNAGGTGARAKLDAARSLGLPVVMIVRPEVPARREFADPAAVADWIAHAPTALGV